MMDLLAPGRKARSRQFTLEQVQMGFGLLILDAPDFPAAERTRLVAEIIRAYEAGQLSGKILDLARRIGTALQTALPTQEALRIHLQTDGRELASRVRTVATMVPSLAILANWID